jgi:PAS domain S-box-containing protein
LPDGDKPSDEELEQRLARAEAALQVIPYGIQHADLQGRIVAASDAYHRMLGYAPGELIGYHIWDFDPSPEQVRRVRDYFEHLVAEQPRPEPFASQNRRRDGTIIDVLVHWDYRRDECGALRGFTSVVTDISPVENAHRALRESEERFRTVLEGLPGGVFAHDLDGRFLLVNEAACNNTGFGREELLELTVADIDPDSVPRDDQRVLWQRLASGGFAHLESVHRRRDGSRYPVEVHLSAIQLDGRPAVLAVAYDITERQGLERELRESEMRFRMLVESAPVAILAMRDGKYVFGNPAAAALLGYPHPDDFTGLDGLQTIAPEFRDAVRERMLRVAEGWANPPQEMQLLRRNGQRVWVISTSVAVQLDGRPAVLIVGQNITRQKRIEEEKARLEEQYRQAQKMESVGRLAGGVAHDFNNMLSVILGNVQLADSELPPVAGVRAQLEEIERAARHSVELTRQLLAFARKQTVSPLILDLNETVAGMLGMLQRLIGEEIALRWRPAADLWPIMMDPGQIDQLLVNLCLNARDAIGGVGEIAIETARVNLGAADGGDEPEHQAGDHVLLSVSDSGAGMDAETLGKIFDPFFTTKPKGKGTGLGLSTVYGIVMQNGGFVTVDSEPGQGTCFRLYFPRYAGEPCRPRRPARAEAATPLGSETLLLVEDEPAVLALGEQMLRKLGYRVLTAATPAAAIELVAHHEGPIHLVITDVVMPEMNGRDLAERLLALRPELKVLYMSGHTDDAIARHGVLQDGLHFMHKPFSRLELADKVREALDA